MLIVAVRKAAAGPTLPRQGDGRHGRSEGAEQTKAATNSRRAGSRMARAQNYPARPVRIIVGFAAGGSTDLYARLMGQWLSERLGQPFIIHKRPSAGSNIRKQDWLPAI